MTHYKTVKISEHSYKVLRYYSGITKDTINRLCTKILEFVLSNREYIAHDGLNALNIMLEQDILRLPLTSRDFT